MNERDRETVKLIANVLGNIAAIATGIAIFEGKYEITEYAFMFGAMAFLTIRSLK